MANQNPPKKGQAFTACITLENFTAPGEWKSSPTLAAGDFKIDKDGAGFNNFATLPTVTPAASVSVLISLSATEMTADRIMLTGIDQTAPKEWADWSLCILTTP